MAQFGQQGAVLHAPGQAPKQAAGTPLGLLLRKAVARNLVEKSPAPIRSPFSGSFI